ncbi:MAG: methylamine dehydrogenase (amicyanin) light chain [Parvibaculum sp.]|nr:methylamine dehydrogenase (amicyanin) light chain [Parvibaculum sp.]|tara:strand:- start:31 stop:543 length:513 start_codon:yes stop_codon:yes gene_type:complete
MTWFDRFVENTSRTAARLSSRRSVVAGIGTVLAGAAAFPLLPVSRVRGEEVANDPGDPESCDYWRYCAIDGYLCSCCGGTHTACPPGTIMSPITWVGTCLNPGDNKHYIISYNDCCGKSGCGRCGCVRNEGDKPMYLPQASNNINWCAGGSADIIYNCSTAIIIGVDDDA